tara:strand:+ start:1416 stop:2057 length:642 start_codon:yes stop_codon:yes gene_type:complete
MTDKLFEDKEENPNTPESSLSVKSSSLKARKSLDSVDDQIDALILRYEASSIRDETTETSGLMETSLNRRNLKYLIEQDEEMDAPPEQIDAPADEDDTEDAAAPEPVGSEKMDAAEPGDEKTPDLDLDAFAARTVRLIVNYKSLLDIEAAITNRVKNFLDINYGEHFVQEYLDILEKQYGISLEEFRDERDIKDDKFAVGAFAGGTGGLGGGG